MVTVVVIPGDHVKEAAAPSTPASEQALDAGEWICRRACLTPTVGIMLQYAALLRGIAPSGTNMTNDKLCGVFVRLGFATVGSVLASGNIVFRSASADVLTLEQRVEEALASDLGIASRTIIRAYPELRSLLDSDPFPGLMHGNDTYLTATFLKDAATAPEIPPDQPDPRIRVVRYDRGARAVLAITNINDPGKAPDLMSWLEKYYGRDITTRSWLTVQRIVKKLES
jgi:uncharacterized protein (DUF1697 family)